MVTGLVAPRIGSVRHPRRATLGPLLAEVAAGLGYRLHDWQAHVADVSLELVRRRGPGSRLRLAAGTVGVVVGRQSGKTLLCAARAALQCLLPDLSEAAEVVGADSIRPQFVGYLAQDRSAALRAWHEHVDLLVASPLADSVERVVLQRGDECVRFVNGSSYRIVTPSRTGARGLSLDLVVVDEAMAHDVELLAAVSPTMAQRNGAAGCVGAQLVIVSSAGDARSTLLAGQRELGRRAALEGDTSRVWFEWSCEDDADPLDEDVWRATIPTLGRRDGVDVEYLRMSAETLGADAFATEYLCRAARRDPAKLIDPAVWAALPADELDEHCRVVFAVDASPDRSSAAVVAAGHLDDDDGESAVAVELVEYRDGPVDWVARYVAGLAVRHNGPVVLDGYGPLSSIVGQLTRAPGVRVRTLRVGDVVDAAAGFCDLVTAGRLAHMDDPRLADAVASAGRRRVGDRWAFSRSGPTDISPLVAASLAVHAVVNGLFPRPAIHPGPNTL